MKITWFHTVGVGQYFGTCKFHRYEHCGHLRKKRPHWRGPILKWGTTDEYTSVEYEETDIPDRKRCKRCENQKSMKTSQEIPIGQILNTSTSPAATGKSEAVASLIAAAWVAKQRGEKTITFVTDTTAHPCKCCNPPFEL